MKQLQELQHAIEHGKALLAVETVETLLALDIRPKEILEKGLMVGMSNIGILFKNNEVYVPEVLIAARAMNKALEVLKPYLMKEGVEPIGKAIVCTVSGDLHDIGKNLVKMMLEGQGIACIDLGVDVAPNVVVDAVLLYKPDILCLSALLTTTMVGQQKTIQALKDAGIRDTVCILVGGAPVTKEYAVLIGADGYEVDAASAAILATEIILKNKHNGER